MWTLICPLIDKPFAHKLWLDNLTRLDFPRKEFNLVILDFSYNTDTNMLFENYINSHKHEYKSVKYINTIHKQCDSYVLDGLDKKIHSTFYAKRRSVAETMRIMSQYRGNGHLLLWEDDIIVPTDAWTKLFEVFNWSDDIWAVTGVQYSRQLRMPGKLLAWEWKYRKLFGDADTSPESAVTIMNKGDEKHRGVESVGATATGFVLYKKAFLDNYEFKTEGFYGQDIMAGIYVNSMNKYWMLRWDVKMPHLGIDIDGNFKVYKSDKCLTNVY